MLEEVACDSLALRTCRSSQSLRSSSEKNRSNHLEPRIARRSYPVLTNALAVVVLSIPFNKYSANRCPRNVGDARAIIGAAPGIVAKTRSK